MCTKTFCVEMCADAAGGAAHGTLPTLTEPDRFASGAMPSVFLIHLGVGAMLNGGGSVPPSSKYDIHKCERANFHSVSDRSCTG